MTHSRPRGAWRPLLVVLALLAAVAACGDETPGGGHRDASHGRELFVGYGCGACHQVGACGRPSAGSVRGSTTCTNSASSPACCGTIRSCWPPSSGPAGLRPEHGGARRRCDPAGRDGSGGVPAGSAMITSLPDPAVLVPILDVATLHVRRWRRGGGGRTTRGATRDDRAPLALPARARDRDGRGGARHGAAGQPLLRRTHGAAPAADPRRGTADGHGPPRRDPVARVGGGATSRAGRRGADGRARAPGRHAPPGDHAALASAAALRRRRRLRAAAPGRARDPARTAVLAWSAVGAAARRGDGAALAAVAALAVNALAGAGLGVVLLAAQLPLYDAYAAFGPERSTSSGSAGR
jgi:hypothetical protein